MRLVGTRLDEGFVSPQVWGWVGAGILFVWKDLFLLTLRSPFVHPPEVWGVPGGQVPLDMRHDIDSIRESAEIETTEELGSMPPEASYTGRFVLYPDDIPLQLTRKRQQFRHMGRYPQYYLFRYEVPAEVVNELWWQPDLETSPGAWENDEYAWFTYYDLEDLNEFEVMPGLKAEIKALLT